MNAADAIAQLRATGKLSGANVSGILTLIDEIQHDVDCADCRFDGFEASFAIFKKPVHFTNCTFQTCSLYAAYFLRGLVIEKCEFPSAVTFQSGGHNAMECVFAITDSVFGQFVDFEDCWFTGPVTIKNVRFCSATNLLANVGTPMEVGFDVPPLISDTIGELRINTFSKSAN